MLLLDQILALDRLAYVNGDEEEHAVAMSIRPVRTLALDWYLHVGDLEITQDKRISGVAERRSQRLLRPLLIQNVRQKR